MSSFWRVLWAHFVSQVGSHFLTLALSAYILQKTESLFSACLIFVASFLPSALLSHRIGRFLDRRFSKRNVIITEGLSIFVTGLVGVILLYDLGTTTLIAAMGLRSIFSFAGKSFLLKWIKLITSSESQKKAMKLFSFVFFISTAISGLLVAGVFSVSGIGMVIFIDIITYVVAIGIFWSIPKPVSEEESPVDQKESSRSALFQILSKPELSRAFLRVMLTQALFNGSYFVLVTYLPLEVFQRGASGVGPFQIAASLGIILGFGATWYFPEVFKNKKWIEGMVLLGGVVALLFLSQASFLAVALVLFFVANFSYEWVWLHFSSEFFALSSTNDVAKLQFAIQSWGAALMSVYTIALALGIGSIGLTASVIGLLVLSAVIFWLWQRLEKSYEKCFVFRTSVRSS